MGDLTISSKATPSGSHDTSHEGPGKTLPEITKAYGETVGASNGGSETCPQVAEKVNKVRSDVDGGLSAPLKEYHEKIHNEEPQERGGLKLVRAKDLSLNILDIAEKNTVDIEN